MRQFHRCSTDRKKMGNVLNFSEITSAICRASGGGRSIGLVLGVWPEKAWGLRGACLSVGRVTCLAEVPE